MYKIQNQQNSKEERDATRASLKDLQLQLDQSICEKEALKKQLEENEKELRQNLEEWVNFSKVVIEILPFHKPFRLKGLQNMLMEPDKWQLLL